MLGFGNEPLPRWRKVALAGVAVVTSVGVALLLEPYWRAPPPPPPPPSIVVAGTTLERGGDVVAAAMDQVRRYAQTEISLKLPEGAHKLLPARLGAEIDRVRLAEFVMAAGIPTSALARAHEAARAAGAPRELEVPLPIRLDTERALAHLLALKAEIDRPATDAMIDLDKRAVAPERFGFRLDVYETLARLDVALARGVVEVEAAGERVRPRRVASELREVSFAEVLGHFETRYSKGARYQARTYNLRLAASRLDGTVLLPGEVFDFNEVVGPRDEAHGYRVAPVIAQGELVDGIGGGTCQISGTLHGAAFFAGLEVVERVPHSRPSSYIKLGLDAAVAYPTVNFRIKNPFAFPVVLHQIVKDGIVRAEVLGPRRTNTVTFFRRIDEVIPFEQELRDAEELPEGERVLTQRGIPGFKTTVFRVVRDGAYAMRTKTSNEYPPTTQIVRVGTGAPNVKRGIEPDKSLEYMADEYLVVTQGPAMSPLESRTPGRYGAPGWQKKLGMKVFEEPDAEEEEKREGESI